MKKVKIILGLFVLTCIMSAAHVNAESLGFTGVTVPGWQGVYTSPTMYKQSHGRQTIEKYSALDSFSSDERAIGARLKGVTSNYVTTVKNAEVDLPGTNPGAGMLDGNYQLQLRANKLLATSASFNGYWKLDYFSS